MHVCLYGLCGVAGWWGMFCFLWLLSGKGVRPRGLPCRLLFLSLLGECIAGVGLSFKDAMTIVVAFGIT